MRRISLVLLVTVTLFAGPLRGAGAASSGQAGEGTPILRPARRPSELEVHRMGRWLEAWRRRAGPVERAVAAVGPHGRGAEHLRKSACMDLAAALLELDRRAVLPAPDPAVSLHVERGLRRLTRTAITCLTRRRYAARRALEEAREAFGEAERLLRRYELDPDDLGALAR